MSYHGNTYDSPNPLIRFAHRRRLEKALEMIGNSANLRLLDYGCGDGLFLAKLAQRHHCADRIFGFEPYMNVLPKSNINIFREWESAEQQFQGDQAATIVTCFEVFEHLPLDKQAQALVQIRRVLRQDGRLIISVPIECGLPSLPKNIFRYMRFSRTQYDIYNLKNIVKSVLSIPIPECRSGSDYLSHMGFYFKDLEKIIEQYFLIIKKTYSPFFVLGASWNSQVFYKLAPIKR